jgi:hypothetical protein
MVLQFTYSPLGDCVLEVGVTAAEREGLPPVCNCLTELVVSEPAVVGMVVKDLDALRRRISLEAILGLEVDFCR